MYFFQASSSYTWWCLNHIMWSLKPNATFAPDGYTVQLFLFAWILEEQFLKCKNPACLDLGREVAIHHTEKQCLANAYEMLKNTGISPQSLVIIKIEWFTASKQDLCTQYSKNGDGPDVYVLRRKRKNALVSLRHDCYSSYKFSNSDTSDLLTRGTTLV